MMLLKKPDKKKTSSKKWDSTIEVESDEKVWLDIDGESPGRLDARFEILPGLLKLKTCSI